MKIRRLNESVQVTKTITKTYDVDSCKYCPYFHSHLVHGTSGYEYICTHENGDYLDNKVVDAGEIDPSCPFLNERKESD